MPRVTRAALRSNALLEESTTAALTPLALIPVKERVALGEITDNRTREMPTLESIGEVKQTGKMDSGKSGCGKGKKGKVVKKGKKQVQKIEGGNVEVLEDDNQSDASSAVEEACQDLMKECSGEIHQVVLHDQRPRSPPSPAVFALRNVLSPKAKTPRFDPKIHKSDITMTTPVTDSQDEFANAVVSQTPARILSIDGAMEDTSKSPIENVATPLEEVSFAAQIQTGSPAKSSSRIEDSMEAIDAFEDEIEKMGELFPVLKDEPQLPTEGTNKGGLFGEFVDKSTNLERKASGKSKPVTAMAGGPKVVRKATNPTPAQTPATRSKQLTTRKTTAAAGVSRLSSIKRTPIPKISPTLGPAKAPAPTHARVSSLQKAPFQPAKSSKPPTRPSFELPGEAISRKLKEQREERLKKEGQGEVQKKTFKARPVRLSHAPVVKPTATSKARMSLAKADPTERTTVKNQAPAIKPLTPRISMATNDKNKRLSTLRVGKRISTVPTNKPACAARGPSLGGSTISCTTSLTPRNSLLTTTSAPRAANAPPAATGVRQTSRGKEVFGRTKVELEARDKERKEKEEAARKARVEAAERGRLASRMWAERQKVRKMGGGAGAAVEAKVTREGETEAGVQEVVG